MRWWWWWLSGDVFLELAVEAAVDAAKRGAPPLLLLV